MIGYKPIQSFLSTDAKSDDVQKRGEIQKIASSSGFCIHTDISERHHGRDAGILSLQS